MTLLPGSSCVSPTIKESAPLVFPRGVTEALTAPDEDPRVSQVLRPIVQVRILQNDVEMGFGSGFVFAVQESEFGDWYSYVLTAAHVIDYEATHDLHVKFYTNGIELSIPADVAYVDDTYDFAILTVPFRYNYAVAIAESSPKLFQKVYSAGVAVIEIPLCNPGELTGDRGDEWIVSAPSNWGYSGGACMAYISGQWRAVGIITMMGKVADPTFHDHPVYHTIVVLKMDVILAKLEAEQVGSH